jgi:hypothetical protein
MVPSRSIINIFGSAKGCSVRRSFGPRSVYSIADA